MIREYIMVMYLVLMVNLLVLLLSVLFIQDLLISITGIMFNNSLYMVRFTCHSRLLPSHACVP